MLSNKEKIIIEIDPDTGTYTMDITYCNAARLKGVLEDILQRIKDRTLFKEEGLELTYHDNN